MFSGAPVTFSSLEGPQLNKKLIEVASQLHREPDIWDACVDVLFRDLSF